ncbi:MAG: DUF4124 domain-containing protein [Usitatibacter sp.]
MPNRRAEALAAMAALSIALACGGAAAQALYKWVDADGKTQYSDRPPKNFAGPVTRLEPDEQPMAPPRAAERPATRAQRAEESAGTAPDSAALRRMLRQKLEAAVASARAKLEGARAALDSASSPGDDERQVIQQKLEKGSPMPGAGSATTGGMSGSGGMHGGVSRANCRTVKGSDGKTITTCPTMVPNEVYYEHVKVLEDAVKAAEEELAAAEQAYRRGVD